jgi:hypothetical protein
VASRLRHVSATDDGDWLRQMRRYAPISFPPCRASGEEIARVGAGFNEVSRSLGLQWPSPPVAEKLLARAVAAVNSANSDTMGDVLQALATKLTEAAGAAGVRYAARTKRQDNQSPRGPCAGRGASGGFWGMSLMAAMALPAIWRFYRARRLAGLPIPVQTNKLWSLPSVCRRGRASG